MTAEASGGAPPAARGGALEVFGVALGLGLSSFGGPIAHLGYFERTYVQRRRWLSADDYAGLVALCQMLPGPASSQVGFLIGLRRAGWPGALATWLGFTLPSALLMFAFALLAPRLSGPLTQSVLHGLKLVAVAVVAQAVWSMAPKLCPDLGRAALALIAASLLLLVGGPLMQLVALGLGAIGGVLLCRDVRNTAVPPKLPVGRRTGLAWLSAFVGLLIALPLAAEAAPRSLLGMAALFYKAGALVFGGGHVVLPLLRDALVPPGWLSDNAFLSGYGAAQALPGPLFTFAAYLGAVVAPHGSGVGVAGLWSATALVFIFLPGLLVALAGLPLWNWIGGHPAARGALAGVNAAVVGVLGAALYNPIWTSAVLGPRDLAIALIAFMLLERWRAPPVLIVVFCVAAAVVSGLVR
ncbi:MAG TPA: chromate efflux transporter [Caulobacteraceae bacterium]|jgi:chromate transporter|nr:chromate efflux transporter [Caulobacteraceae bacterium]